MLSWMNEYIGNPNNPAVDGTFFGKNVEPMNFFERLNNFLLTARINLQANYYMRGQNKYIEKYFGQGYPNTMDIQKDLSLVFLNYNSAITGIKPLAPIAIPIAGIHIQDHEDSLPQV